MITPSDPQKAVDWIKEAQAASESSEQACHAVGLSARTYQRWGQGGSVKHVCRPMTTRPAPANKLTPQECAQILTIGTQSTYQNVPPGLPR